MSALIFGLAGTGKSGAGFSRRILDGILVILVGALVSMPWWLTVSLHHGTEIFASASDSFNSLGFLNYILHPKDALPVISEVIYKLNKTPLLAIPTLLGLIFSLLTLRWTIPLWFAANIIIWGGYDLFLIPIAAILSTSLIVELGRAIVHRQDRLPENYAPFAAALLVLTFLIWNYTPGYKEIARHTPVISSATLEFSDWMQSNTSPESTFLRLTTSPEEAEWYPYLLRRTPVLGSWGSEWTGDYQVQLGAVRELVACSSSQSMACIDDLLLSLNARPDYLILTKNQSIFIQELESRSSWAQVYDGSVFIVWESVIAPDH